MTKKDAERNDGCSDSNPLLKEFIEKIKNAEEFWYDAFNNKWHIKFKTDGNVLDEKKDVADKKSD